MNPPTETAFMLNQLGRLCATVEAMKETADDQNKKSAEYRALVTDKLEKLEDRMESLESVSASNARVLKEDVLPTVKKVKIWEQRGIGFLAAAGMVGTGIGASIMNYSADLSKFFASFFK